MTSGAREMKNGLAARTGFLGVDRLMGQNALHQLSVKWTGERADSNYRGWVATFAENYRRKWSGE